MGVAVSFCESTREISTIVNCVLVSDYNALASASDEGRLKRYIAMIGFFRKRNQRKFPSMHVLSRFPFDSGL